MSVRYRFDRERRLLLVQALSGASEASLFDYARRVTEDPAVPRARDELVDLRGLDASRVSSSALQRLASLFESSEKGEPARVAIVAPSDLGFGLSRMYQAFRGDGANDIRVFRELEEACAWLGLTEPPVFDPEVG